MSHIQAVLFRKDRWTITETKKFLSNHNIMPIKEARETKNFYRYRIEEPENFKYMRTKKLPNSNGIEFVLGFN
jgi:hypothetical protein